MIALPFQIENKCSHHNETSFLGPGLPVKVKMQSQNVSQLVLHRTSAQALAGLQLWVTRLGPDLKQSADMLLLLSLLYCWGVPPFAGGVRLSGAKGGLPGL